MNPCILCNHDEWRVRWGGVVDYLTDETFDVDRCARCGLMVTRPFVPDAEMDRHYPPRYRGNRHSFTGRMRTRLRRRAVAAAFPRGFTGTLLDIGAGDGSFVREMQSLGWRVSATEFDADAVETLRAEGVDARCSSAASDSPEAFDGPFDAITTWHVLEHVDRPMELTRWAASKLSAGGVFQATVPDAGCWQARLFGRRWLHLDVPRHRFHFTQSTLRRLVESAGLRVDKMANVAVEYDLFGVIQSGLNGVCRRPNALFERLMHGQFPAGTSTSDVMKSVVLAPPLAAAGAAAVPVMAVFGNGATLTVTCRAAG